ncbi:hypothetical protein BH09PAT2_BH09PAT2_01680 [soil metagenome]
MTKQKKILLVGMTIILLALFVIFNKKAPINTSTDNPSKEVPITGSFDKSKQKSDSEWRKILTPEEYHILREQGTEIPFTGALEHEKRKGTYYSVGCDIPLFRSETKYDSGTGWPSFWAPISPDSVILREDNLLGSTRTEVLDQCGGHLGHVFDDGPEPTGKRYCMNSVALRFVPDKEQ